MFNREAFEKALKIKGYGSYKEGTSDSEIRKIRTVKGETPLKVQPALIRSLNDYIEFTNGFESSFTNPVFYRGQGNANFILTPNCLRVDSENENIMIEMFSRRFQNEIDKCKNSMAKLVLMQHFTLPTRCFDISENPLMALYFACSPMKKFCKNREEEMSNWGEVIVFQEPGEEKDKNKRPEDLKGFESSNVSIIANTAFMDKNFSLWHLAARWKKDVGSGHDENYIDLRTIVRRSYIVRVPQTNERIRNQQGAFIMLNANYAYGYNNKKDKIALTNLILEQGGTFRFCDLKETALWKEREEESWYLHFEKVTPYSDENKIEIFKTDPFDLKRLFYKKNGIQQVALIPPDAKQNIIDELKLYNITEDFAYPDMDNVAHEISEKINKQEEERRADENEKSI